MTHRARLALLVALKGDRCVWVGLLVLVGCARVSHRATHPINRCCAWVLQARGELAPVPVSGGQPPMAQAHALTQTLAQPT